MTSLELLQVQMMAALRAQGFHVENEAIGGEWAAIRVSRDRQEFVIEIKTPGEWSY